MRLTISSDALAVRTALLAIRNTLIGRGVGDDDLDRVEIVMAEILNNVVEHACEERTGGQIEIEVVRDRSDLRVEVVDGGREMPGQQVPEGTQADLGAAIDELPEGGFGWFLIHDLTREIAYERRDGHNHLSFAIELQPHPADTE